MLTFGDSRRIFLARQAIDMRKGCVSLAALVENALGEDPVRYENANPLWRAP